MSFIISNVVILVAREETIPSAEDEFTPILDPRALRGEASKRDIIFIRGKAPVITIAALRHTAAPSSIVARPDISSLPERNLNIPSASPTVISVFIIIPNTENIFTHTEGQSIRPTAIIPESKTRGRRLMANALSPILVRRPAAIHPTGIVTIPHKNPRKTLLCIRFSTIPSA